METLESKRVGKIRARPRTARRSPAGTASACSEAGGPDSVLRHLSRSEEPNYDSGFVFYEVVKLQHRGACLESTERPQIQVLGVDTRIPTASGSCRSSPGLPDELGGRWKE